MKEPSNKKKLITIGIIAFSTLSLGIGAAFLLHDGFGLFKKQQENDPSKLEEIDETDSAALYKKYLKIKDQTDDFTTVFDEQELANLSLYLFDLHETNRVISIGKSVATIGVEQNIWSYAVRDHDNYFEESKSKSSVVAIHDRMYQHDGYTTYYYTGTPYPNTPSEGDFLNADAVKITNEEYADFIGRNISNPCIYFINENTVIEKDGLNRSNKSSGIPTSSTKTESGYVIEIELDNLYGTKNYIKQMKGISNLYQYPTFSYVHLTFELDSSLEIKYLRSKEKYYAKTSSVLGSELEATMTIRFEVDGAYQMPNLTDVIEYPEFL